MKILFGSWSYIFRFSLLPGSVDLEKTNFVWKQVSKPPWKLLVQNKQHKQLIDRAKPDDVHFLFSNSSFLLPFWFIRRHFNQKFNHFSLPSSLKPAPGMSPGIRSTWPSYVLVTSNLPQGPKAHFQATSVFFFLTCDQQVSFFLESENYRISSFLGAPFSLKKALLQEPSMQENSHVCG